MEIDAPENSPVKQKEVPDTESAETTTARKTEVEALATEELRNSKAIDSKDTTEPSKKMR